MGSSAHRRTPGFRTAEVGRRALRISAILGLLGLAFHVAHTGFDLGGNGLDFFTDNELYDSLVTGAAIACLARGLTVRLDRTAWLCIGVGLLFNAAGEIYYSVAFGDNGNPPIPSPADALYLTYYPFIYAGLVLLLRRRLQRFSASTWLDGAIAAATTAALMAAIAVDPIVRATKGHLAAVATTLAYPIGDLLLLSIVVAVFSLSGWRPGRAWLLLGAGLVFGAFADSLYAYLNATDSYTVGTLLDSCWPASTLAIAFAAWQRPGREQMMKLDGMRLLVVPGLFAGAALGLLVYGGLQHVPRIAFALAGGAMFLVVVRAAWTFAENLRLLEASRKEAITDPLTGLGNRRRLIHDLGWAIRAASPDHPLVLLLFDLNDFKLYNDSFGHMAGDTMLGHLGRRLGDSVAPRGRAYRLGGDEFCALLPVDLGRAKPLVAAACAALASSGDGFEVSAAFGQVAIPHEVQDATAALRMADDRMYAHKGGNRRKASARQQTHDVLLSVLRERQPELHKHLREVSRLVLPVGCRLGMEAEALDELVRAANLHDVGKAAIPEDILNKKGPLNAHEWTFMRRHTIVGQRILSAALGPVGLLVRSSHEHWDGSGYPDGLAGEAIPLGARIISVCDAFDAIVSERSYAGSDGEAEALAELRENAGSKFDPVVVEAFIAERQAADLGGMSELLRRGGDGASELVRRFASEGVID